MSRSDMSSWMRRPPSSIWIFEAGRVFACFSWRRPVVCLCFSQCWWTIPIGGAQGTHAEAGTGRRVGGAWILISFPIIAIMWSKSSNTSQQDLLFTLDIRQFRVSVILGSQIVWSAGCLALWLQFLDWFPGVNSLVKGDSHYIPRIVSFFVKRNERWKIYIWWKTWFPATFPYNPPNVTHIQTYLYIFIFIFIFIFIYLY
jgi:hypothetical protein